MELIHVSFNQYYPETHHIGVACMHIVRYYVSEMSQVRSFGHTSEPKKTSECKYFAFTFSDLFSGRKSQIHEPAVEWYSPSMSKYSQTSRHWTWRFHLSNMFSMMVIASRPHPASNTNSIKMAERSPANLVSDNTINTYLRVRAEEIEARALFKPNRSILLFQAYIKLLSYCKSHPIESTEHRYRRSSPLWQMSRPAASLCKMLVRPSRKCETGEIPTSKNASPMDLLASTKQPLTLRRQWDMTIMQS